MKNINYFKLTIVISTALGLSACFDGSNDIADVSVISNATGVAKFSVPKHGKWMFASVWGVPLKGDSRAEFESYFASLTIGF